MLEKKCCMHCKTGLQILIEHTAHELRDAPVAQPHRTLLPLYSLSPSTSPPSEVFN